MGCRETRSPSWNCLSMQPPTPSRQRGGVLRGSITPTSRAAIRSWRSEPTTPWLRSTRPITSCATQTRGVSTVKWPQGRPERTVQPAGAAPHPAERATLRPDRTRAVGAQVSREVPGGRTFGRLRLALTRVRFCDRATPPCSSSIGAHFRACRLGRARPKSMNPGERPLPPGPPCGVAARTWRPTFRR
jgi:hypothetical protein